VELYFDDLEAAKRFYQETSASTFFTSSPGITYSLKPAGHSYAWRRREWKNTLPAIKPCIFLEVADVRSAGERLGKEKVVHFDVGNAHGGSPWAVLHDPEGQNVLLLQANNR